MGSFAARPPTGWLSARVASEVCGPDCKSCAEPCSSTGCSSGVPTAPRLWVGCPRETPAPAEGAGGGRCWCSCWAAAPRPCCRSASTAAASADVRNWFVMDGTLNARMLPCGAQKPSSGGDDPAGGAAPMAMGCDAWASMLRRRLASSRSIGSQFWSGRVPTEAICCPRAAWTPRRRLRPRAPHQECPAATSAPPARGS
jgi:hypothetical protein